MHIRVILCALSPRCDHPDPCHQVTSVSSCMCHISMCLMLWGALAHPSMSTLACTVYTNTKPYRRTKRKTLLDFLCENGSSSLPYSHAESLVRIAFDVLWHIWVEALLDFHHENKVKCYQIFAVEIWQRFQTHLESINRDHTHPETKPQSPMCLKHQKLMPIAHFQLPVSLNYDFTKTKDCLRIDVMEYLIASPHVTGLSNSRIKIFLSIHIRLGKMPIFLT